MRGLKQVKTLLLYELVGDMYVKQMYCEASPSCDQSMTVVDCMDQILTTRLYSLLDKQDANMHVGPEIIAPSHVKVGSSFSKCVAFTP